MERPVKSKFVPDRQTVELLFEKDIKPYYHAHLETGVECFVRGAVVWPQGLTHGYVIVGAQHLDDGVTRIYEERSFQSVSPDKRVGLEPVMADFMAELWEHYYCRHFFTESTTELDPNHRRFLVQVSREPLIDPKPIFPLAYYAKDEDAADALLTEQHAARRIKIRKRGPIYEQLQQIRTKEISELPAVRALRCLLSGIERAPWRAPQDRHKQVMESYF